MNEGQGELMCARTLFYIDSYLSLLTDSYILDEESFYNEFSFQFTRRQTKEIRSQP